MARCGEVICNEARAKVNSAIAVAMSAANQSAANQTKLDEVDRYIAMKTASFVRAF